MKKELLEFFQFDIDTTTASAFNQHRTKLLPEALAFLFHDFNQAFEDFKTYHGYRLFACDGSDLYIARNPEDHDTYFQSSLTSFNIPFFVADGNLPSCIAKANDDIRYFLLIPPLISLIYGFLVFVPP